MKYLTKEEVGRLLVCIDNERDKLLIQLGLVLGCRVSEIVNIRVKNIYPDRIKLWDEKKDEYREVVCDPSTREALNAYHRTLWVAKPHRPHLLFYFSPKTANRIVKRWFRVAQIPPDKAHWHTLRHTYVVQSLNSDVPINHVCAQTGDTANTVVRTYGTPSIDARLQMMTDRGAFWRT